MDLFDMAENHTVGKLFYSEDAPEDIGIYESGNSKDGSRRPIYRTSVDTIEKARDLCDRTNRGELDFGAYLKKNAERAEEAFRWNEHLREMERDAMNRLIEGVSPEEDLDYIYG